MMLHEAVMLEIYRQALNASELASPRCHSRESNNSGVVADIRCPSNDSHCSGNENFTPAGTPIPTTPPGSLPLPASLGPAAATALLPPQSAMAAYLNAAAAAAQQNHLLLTNPLAAAASFVQQATQGHSEDLKRTPNSSPYITETPALDFSTKQSQKGSEDGSNVDEDDDAEEDNKTRNLEENELEADENDNTATDDANAPLDLSLNAGRKRQSDDEEIPSSKTPRLRDYKPLQPGSWVPPINPYLAAVAAAGLSPKADCWSNKSKFMPNEATKALEKMTEMTRLGASTVSNENVRSTTQTTPVSNTTTSTSNGRHSAWQSHWLTKGADAVKDVFKCVWCKQSFPTLASLTVHMKETQHCGVNVPAAVAAGAVNSNANSNAVSAMSNHAPRHSSRELSASNIGASGGSSNIGNSTSNAAGSNAASGKSDLNLLIKETMPLPRKLVRGQDVWLGKGAEQTRQILKCMWCGQSFRSLAEMTSHMQETQHYTNIISQEQIISWKSSDEKVGGSNGSSSVSTASNAAREASMHTAAAAAAAASGATVNTAVSAVLTCKVCDQAFSTLKELSNHMVKNSHYKEHMIRAAPTPNIDSTVSSSSPPNAGAGRRGGRQGRGEKRKKSLPVRKLLELERAQHEYKGSNSSLDSALKPLRDFAASTKITCEKCGDKIETALFVDHIRQCLGGHIPMSPRHNNNNNNNHNNNNNNTLKGSCTEASSREQTPHSIQSLDGRKTADNEINSASLAGSTRSEILCPLPKEGEKITSSTPSVLNAIEQLIEKSFDTRVRSGSSSYGATGSSSKPNTPLGSSILKRLGIDDSADYTKPLMDAQTMNFLRSYSSYSAPRDRSASESSSVSERCSSRFDSSVTPERNADFSRQPTPRLMTPEKPMSLKVNVVAEVDAPKIKNEPDEDAAVDDSKPLQKISVKKEFNMPEDSEQSVAANNSRAASPNLSERSATPKSHTSTKDDKISNAAGVGSLNALSSMFDSLNNRGTAGNSSSSNLHTNETNNNQTGVKKSTANPLAALQKLCETTNETTTAANNRSNSTAMPSSNGASVAANMVSFSWACNDGVSASADASIKCSYCDTPFTTKGAYRHHLCKVHFIKDDGSEGANSLKSPNLNASPKSMPASSPKRGNSKSPINQRQSVSPAAASVLTPTINPYDESPQAKFLKYTELAKQLSSKNA